MTATRLLTVTMLLAVVALAGCGRKGALDTPYEASVIVREEAEEAGTPLPPERKKPVADRPFILDGLID